MRILITGATGFIGGRVARQAIVRGHEIVVTTRKHSKTDRIDGIPQTRYTADITDKQSLIQAVVGVDAIIHLAGISSWESMTPESLERVSFQGTANILEVAAESSPGIRFVFVSSVAALGFGNGDEIMDEEKEYNWNEIDVPYSHMKRRCEELVNQYSDRLHVCSVLPGEVYGEGDRDGITCGTVAGFIDSCCGLATTGSLSIVHVDDVATGCLLAAEHGENGERYILGGENMTVTEMCRLCRSIAGQSPTTLTIPGWTLEPIASVTKRLRLPELFPPAIIPYAKRNFKVCSQKAQRKLGYQPRSAHKTLTKLIKWIRNEDLQED